MHPTLFLTLEESALFAKLSEDLRHGWHMADETSGAYESQDELEKRFAGLSLGDSPDDRAFAEVLIRSLEKGSLDAHVIDAIPQEYLIKFLHAIGACGICALIETALMSKHVTREMLTSIALLSGVRHRLLLQNAMEASFITPTRR